MKPAFRLEILEPGQTKARDITNFAAGRLMSLRVVDVAGFKSDSMELVLDFRPEPDGTPLRLPPSHRRMSLFLGYENDLKELGDFIVDKLNLALECDVMSVRASAADWRSPMNATRTVSWDNLTIGAIVATIAARYGFKAVVSEPFAGRRIAHIDQTRESDLKLLTRLAIDNGAIFKPMNGHFLFYARGLGRTATGKFPPPITIVKNRDLLDGIYDTQDRDRFEAVEAVWHDYDTGLDHVVRAGPADGKKVYHVRYPYSDESSARHIAEAKYAEFHRGAGTLNLTVIGNPDLRAEFPIKLEGFHKSVPEEWITTRIVHTLDGNGFRSKIEAELPSA